MNKLVLVLFCFLLGNTAFSQRKLTVGGVRGLSKGASNGEFNRDSLSGKQSRKAVKNGFFLNNRLQKFSLFVRKLFGVV